MPFPVTISAASANNKFCGPFLRSTVRYVVVDGAMYKSLDFGTTWNLQDGGNSPSPSTRHAACIAGSIIYLFYYDGSSNLVVQQFDTTTDTWDASVITGSNAGTAGDMVCAYRPTSNTILVVLQTEEFAAVGDPQCDWVSFSIAGQSFGAFTTTGPTEILDPPFEAQTYSWYPVQIIIGNSDLAQLVFQQQPPLVATNRLWYQSLTSGGSLGTLTEITEASSNGEVSPPPVAACFREESNEFVVAFCTAGDPLDEFSVWLCRGTNQVNVTLTVTSLAVCSGTQFVTDVALAANDSGVYLFWCFSDPDASTGTFQYKLEAEDIVELGVLDSITASNFNGIGYTGGWAITFSGTQFYWEVGGGPAPPASVTTRAPGGGGTYFPRFLNGTLLSASMARTQVPAPLSSWFQPPNDYSICLAREFMWYKGIDREALGCARKPTCVLNPDERAWVDAPAGSATFNPLGTIPLPAPAAGDVVVLSFIVPLGYDGIVTAQFHQYTQAWLEGSGDLVWRVRANGRYLRDMGNMQSSIGSVQHLSPCPGGLWVHSGNLVEYVVAAPNTNGSLPPAGTGFVLASLHGWFFPRK